MSAGIAKWRVGIKKLRTVLIIAYWFLLLQQFMESIGSCDNLSKTNAKPSQNDVLVSLQRLKLSSVFNRASVVEVIVMSFVLSGSQSFLWGFVLLNDAIAVRARHIGFVACTPNDKSCCEELECHKFPSCTSPPFLSSTTNWNNRLNYCPMPYFYYNDASAQSACGSLANTPDMASCYRYGCSRQHTPYQHYVVRVMLVLLCVISFMSF